MNVIWHHHPLIQQVLFSIVIEQCFCGNVCNSRPTEQAFAVSLIQITFNLSMQVTIDFFGRFTICICGQLAQCLGVFALKTQQDFSRQGIGKSKRDEIGSAFTFDVRQITARVDATS